MTYFCNFYSSLSRVSDRPFVRKFGYTAWQTRATEQVASAMSSKTVFQNFFFERVFSSRK
jgi:hypothetical protein